MKFTETYKGGRYGSNISGVKHYSGNKAEDIPQKMIIYPNPSSGSQIINISLSQTSSSANLIIYTIQGVPVLNKALPKANVFQINKSDLKPGIYLFKIIDNNYSEVQKVVVE